MILSWDWSHNSQVCSVSSSRGSTGSPFFMPFVSLVKGGEALPLSSIPTYDTTHGKARESEVCRSSSFLPRSRPTYCWYSCIFSLLSSSEGKTWRYKLEEEKKKEIAHPDPEDGNILVHQVYNYCIAFRAAFRTEEIARKYGTVTPFITLASFLWLIFSLVLLSFFPIRVLRALGFLSLRSEAPLHLLRTVVFSTTPRRFPCSTIFSESLPYYYRSCWLSSMYEWAYEFS